MQSLLRKHCQRFQEVGNFQTDWFLKDGLAKKSYHDFEGVENFTDGVNIM